MTAPSYRPSIDDIEVTMSNQGQPAGIDTNDMVSVHGVFRSAFGDAQRHIASAPADRPGRVQLVTDFYSNVFAFLHAHHEGEDEVITPLLLERSSQRDEVARIAAQHNDILAPLAAGETALGAWHDAPNAENAAALENAIQQVSDALTRHLDDEEAGLLPICSAHLSLAEWGGMPGHTMRIFKGDKVWLVLGLVREQMSEQQKANMLANMPPPAVEMWTTQGSAAFDQFVGALRDGS